MAYSLYNKPYRTYVDLVQHLQAKNLTVTDTAKAQEILKKINYYRFKIYLRPFLDQPTNTYRQGATFEQGLELYRFDDELRDLTFKLIGRLEIKLRSRLDQTISEHLNDPFWYLNSFIFENDFNMNSIASKIGTSFQFSRDDFTNNFKSKYFNEANDGFKHLPPFWIAAELTTFGTILSLYKAIDKNKFNNPPHLNKLDILSKEFGARNIRTLNSWLTLIRDVRNRCAHHSRLWNCNYRQPGGVFGMLDQRYQPRNRNRIYLFFAVLHIMCKNIDIPANMKVSLQGLIQKYPAVVPYLPSIGFHPGWALDQIWN
ncbi:Abortive infection bacteriophage resistance protein [Desulfuromusa kysingii]|uniref:Abortive infection bacteriophage resistance protein n=1 Tax=Desulfuromusa kysingii TaxID=37625 RepID=A0A1H3VF78_9BACT|nr:Abi family protein [Desulfuromusa kysingii]SDZ73445.1 Abortive infection bacteriophage resistance protein [Desulfuromusa kysingii]